QKITTIESNIQYKNELTEGSFETKDTIDLTESTPTKTTVKLTNTSKESNLNLVLLTSQEPSWVWKHFSKKYNNNNEIISFIYTICKLKYKSTNTPGMLAKYLYNKHSNYIGNRQSTLENFIDDDWLVVNSLIQLLEPFFIATEILSTSTYPTIIANSINFKLQEYWECVDKSTTIEALLDPQSKTKTFKDINKRDRAIALLHNRMKLYKNDAQFTNINLQSKENKQSFFESLISKQNSEQVTVEDEITRYFATLVDSNTNLLNWWCHFGKDFLIFASIALCYLSVQGSSMPSEQAFSMVANTITKICCNLKPDTAHVVMCLKS
ncbi:3359_t:CDS:2, partial [Dentiscutata heterogama]